jgi:hypothetical protein
MATTNVKAGFRESEVVSIDIQDIDIKRKTFTMIAGKVGKIGLFL